MGWGSPARAGAHRADEPYLVVSSDGHAGPSLERSLRRYCPNELLSEFDAFVVAFRRHQRGAAEAPNLGHVERILAASLGEDAPRSALNADMQRVIDCRAHDDPGVRLRDMDEQGIAAEVIFAGGQNTETLPFVGFGADAGPTDVSPELRAAGSMIWNRWLVDYVSMDPRRLLGVMQIPIWNIPESVTAVRHFAAKGLKAVNLPAPRRDLMPYNHGCYEPLWRACAELKLALVTHAGGGEAPLGFDLPDGTILPGGQFVYAFERLWLARRHLWQMIFGGVFERHPGLKLVLTEQMVAWLPTTLADLDNVAASTRFGHLADRPTRRPSDYWRRNCYNAGSFLAPHEVALREAIGVETLLWGGDYPHIEGTWPYTSVALRYTFAEVGDEHRRRILGLNAIEAYDLDVDHLTAVAAHIGPLPSELDRPVDEREIPSNRVHAFREFENF